MSDWIKCSWRMPDKDDIHCLVFCRDGARRLAFISHGDWAMNGKFYDPLFVTHWQELPEPPKDQ